jgi:hypothetical protein
LPGPVVVASGLRGRHIEDIARGGAHTLTEGASRRVEVDHVNIANAGFVIAAPGPIRNGRQVLPGACLLCNQRNEGMQVGAWVLRVPLT